MTREVFLGPERPHKGSHSPLLNLDLSFNKIQVLPRTAFEHLVNLEEINLSGNPLQIVESHSTTTAIGSLTKLLSLNLSEIGIATLPRHFLKGLIHLKSIDISRNRLEEVPSEIHYDGHDLETLILDENPMEVIKSHSFSRMVTLSKLSICKMPNLAFIHEESFSGLRNLTFLHIDQNPVLGFIDPDAFVDFQDPMILQELSLSHNFLRYLPNRMLPEMNSTGELSLKVFRITGNQWECDCHNQWLVDLINQDQFVEFAELALCTRPSDLKGINLVEAKNQDLPCDNLESFDASKHDFGLPHPSTLQFSIGESRMISLSIAIGCILAILVSILFVSALYVNQKRHISYNRLSAFKIHFRRRETPENLRNSQTSLSNSVYRDNPTTMPIES